MRTEGHGHDREDPLIDMGYESRDVNYRGVGKAMTIFFGFTFVTIVAVGLMLHFNMLSNTGIAQEFPRRTMPANTPLLQTNITAKTDIMTLRQGETKLLTETRVLPDGSVRIPIDRSIKLLAQRGFPATAIPQPAFSPGTTVPENALSPEEAARAKLHPTPAPVIPPTPVESATPKK